MQLSFFLLLHIGGIDLMTCTGQKHLTLLSFHYWWLGNLCWLFDVQRLLYTIWHAMRNMIKKWTFHIVYSCRIETLSKHVLRGCSPVFVSSSSLAMWICVMETRGRIQLNILGVFGASIYHVTSFAFFSINKIGLDKHI